MKLALWTVSAQGRSFSKAGFLQAASCLHMFTPCLASESSTTCCGRVRMSSAEPVPKALSRGRPREKSTVAIPKGLAEKKPRTRSKGLPSLPKIAAAARQKGCSEIGPKPSRRKRFKLLALHESSLQVAWSRIVPPRRGPSNSS